MWAPKVAEYLAKKKATTTGDVAQKWATLEDLHFRKLWHQLTQEVRASLKDETFTKDLDLKEFYDNFINEFEHRINALSLVEIAIPIASFIFKKDRNEAFNFLGKIEKAIKDNKPAKVRVHTAQIELHLANKDANDFCVDIAKIKQAIEDTQKELDEIVGVSEVHAPFYKVSSVYLREIGDFAGYYREALRYLGVEDPNKLTAQEKHYHAVLLGFAALLGQNVYNFGELLAHPILKALPGSSEHWILDVLYAFNEGDLNKFYSLERSWKDWEDIRNKKDFLVEKIRLLSIMEIALARPSNQRTILFSEIAKKAQIETKEVEFLVMKALSKGLIRGAIDQVEQSVAINWVQPRVLNTAQILSMANRLKTWSVDVGSMESLVNEHAKEILTKS